MSDRYRQHSSFCRFSSFLSVFSRFSLWHATSYRSPARNRWVGTQSLGKMIQLFFIPEIKKIKLYYSRRVSNFLSLCVLPSLTGRHRPRGENHKQHSEKIFQMCSSVERTLAGTPKTDLRTHRYQLREVQHSSFSVSIWWTQMYSNTHKQVPKLYVCTETTAIPSINSFILYFQKSTRSIIYGFLLCAENVFMDMLVFHTCQYPLSAMWSPWMTEQVTCAVHVPLVSLRTFLYIRWLVRESLFVVLKCIGFRSIRGYKRKVRFIIMLSLECN